MNLSPAFEKRMQVLLEEEYALFRAALEKPAPVSIRANNKIVYQPSKEQVSWCESGFYLSERPVFTVDPFFHAGVYYVQEASSMFLRQCLKQYFSQAETVLDLCAAPGGKTTLFSQYINENALLVSNEINRSRAYILAENVAKWGNANVVVTNNQPADFKNLPGFFDAMLIDAPCSGEGMFRKNPASIDEWSLTNVENCVVRQRKIIFEVWDTLKTDGILVYSTCTYNRQENDENIKWICEELGAEILRMDIQHFQGILETEAGYRFFPHKIKGEGFFISVLRKTSPTPQKMRKAKKIERKSDDKIKSEVGIKLLEPEKWNLFMENNRLRAVSKARQKEIAIIENNLKCLLSGIYLGDYKNSDFI
ncbi:MAG: RsmB/NOP family class I SAM-dependent RNA methyltransferase, partial [Paludibacteraceae bacterium]|nr:RsmB/NOP family class I SAM-dependent RNA methyltransferase [Paludibacteraceae bacterium]